jgi:GrpB-like predicted nucleotidyltransferase (UPF0157 family)
MTQDEQTRAVLGLEHDQVRLHPYTPLWAQLYRQEEEQINTAIGHLIVDIQHVGSTAVPGIEAKPILDIMAGVKRLEDARFYQAPLAAIGYEHRAHAGIPNDHVFGKGVMRTHILHIVEYGSREWTRNLYFRDALRSDPDLAREYEALKIELARKFSNNRAEYTAAKSAFIRKVIAA